MGGPKPAKIGTQSKSEGHWVPGILEDCDIQFGVYFTEGMGNDYYDVYCFACGKWVCTRTNTSLLGHMISAHEMEPHE